MCVFRRSMNRQWKTTQCSKRTRMSSSYKWSGFVMFTVCVCVCVCNCLVNGLLTHLSISVFLNDFAGWTSPRSRGGRLEEGNSGNGSCDIRLLSRSRSSCDCGTWLRCLKITVLSFFLVLIESRSAHVWQGRNCENREKHQDVHGTPHIPLRALLYVAQITFGDHSRHACAAGANLDDNRKRRQLQREKCWCWAKRSRKPNWN